MVPLNQPLSRPMSAAASSAEVSLLGLDFGSTTCSALVAKAPLLANSVTGHTTLGEVQLVFRSAIEFTPFLHEHIDEVAVLALLAKWLQESGLRRQDIFAGGVIITGLAARQENAQRLSQLIEQQIGEVLIATAHDPGLESWLAFMGSCAALSRFNQDVPLINLDIGGGTTNPALGVNGQVQATGCYFVGARHVQVVPGTYQIRALTPEARALFGHLHIYKQVGDTLSVAEVEKFVAVLVQVLEHIATGDRLFFQQDTFASLQEMPFCLPSLNQPAGVTFSGGVGELVYLAAEGKALPSTTYYGDLGIDLAQAILRSPILARDVAHYVPENRGRATVYGLALHSTEVSGSTLFLPDPSVLPLRNLPVIAQMKASATEQDWRQVLQHGQTYPAGFAVQVWMQMASDGLQQVRQLGGLLAALLTEQPLLPEQTLVLLVDANIGKSLGLYATAWGSLPVKLVVIDEVSLRQAGFVNLGALHKYVVPIAFYGVQ